MVRSPVGICLGTSPIQAQKSRPLVNAAPLPIARNHRTRDDRADARQGHDPSPTAITLCQGLDLVGHDFNSFIGLPPVTGKIGNDALRSSIATRGRR
jgi:hypothetical protein